MRKQNIVLWMKDIIFLCLTILLLIGEMGCGSSSGANDGGDGSENNDVGTGTGSALTDTFTTLNTVGSVVSTALNANTPPALINMSAVVKSSTIHVHCDNNVQATVTGTITGNDSSGTFNLSADLNGCSGVNGTLGFSGTYADSGENREFNVTFSGSAAGNGCLLTLNETGYIFSVEKDRIAAPVTESVTNTMAVSCTEMEATVPVTCNFGSGVNAINLTALQASCECSGDGC